MQKNGKITNKYIKEKYGTSREVRYLNGHATVPIAYVQHRVPMDKKGKTNKYTPEGRLEIHRNLADTNMDVLYHLMNSPSGRQSVEYNDNRIALYVAQKGKCAVSGIDLEANQVDCHHKKPVSLGGDDSYKKGSVTDFLRTASKPNVESRNGRSPLSSGFYETRNTAGMPFCRRR